MVQNEDESVQLYYWISVEYLCKVCTVKLVNWNYDNVCTDQIK